MKTIINQILDQMIVFSLDCSLWSGEKKLRPEDLGGAILPPDKLASLGSKRVFDPESLKIFKTLKKRAERSLLEVGVRFHGAYAVPEAKLAEINDTLEQIGVEFENAKMAFLQEYDTKLADWLAEAGEWSEIVRRAIEPASAVACKIAFGFAGYKVGAPVAGQSPEDQIGGLSSQLMREIAQAAKEASVYFTGRTEVTRKALSPLNNIKSKLEGLMFLNPTEIGGLVKNVNETLMTVPKSGPISGAVLMGIVGVLNQMAGIKEFVAAAQSVQEDVDLADVDAVPADHIAAEKAHRNTKKPKATVVPEPVAADAEEEEMIQEVEVIPELDADLSDSWFW